jgi:hypothetical protein
MELPASTTYSDKSGEDFGGKKPHIPKGYYVGRLAELKLRANKNGEPVLKEYKGGDKCKQMVMLFEVYARDAQGNIGHAIEVPISDNPNQTKTLTLASVINYETTKLDGQTYSCFTPKSRSTQTFVAMGWVPNPNKPLVFKDYLGSLVELNIDDQEKTVLDASGKVSESYKASVITKVGKYEGQPSKPLSPSEATTPQKVPANPSLKDMDAIKKKRELVEEMHMDGSMSQDGYEKAIEQLYAAERALRRG